MVLLVLLPLEVCPALATANSEVQVLEYSADVCCSLLMTCSLFIGQAIWHAGNVQAITQNSAAKLSPGKTQVAQQTTPKQLTILLFKQ